MQRLSPLIFILFMSSPAYAGGDINPYPLSSLHSYTGIWDMPTARILPDWHARFKYSNNNPYRYYGVALGLFDRLEFHGQFTEVTTLQASAGEGYGYYKDRNAGARLVIKKEDDLWPQIAIGAYDPIGTSLYPSRYIVASKIIGNWDLTFGLGQGLLGGQTLEEIETDRVTAGEFSAEHFDTRFLFSDPLRQTRPFAGIEYHARPNLIISTEYSSLKYEGLHGSPPSADWPINIGVKYIPWRHITLQGGYMKGNEWSFGMSADIPLSPEAMLPWQSENTYLATEENRWQAYEADNHQLATLIAQELQKDGFTCIETSANDHEVWVDFANSKYLSHSKALGRVATILDKLCPRRIDVFYLGLSIRGQIIQSLKSKRKDIHNFLQHKTDKEEFLALADLDLYRDNNHDPGPETYRSINKKFDWTIDFKLKTFLNNRSGFFKHKGFIQPRLNYYPWQNATFSAEAQLTLFNQWDDLIFSPLEPEPTRTDLVQYERTSTPRISELSFNQFIPLPYQVLSRFSFGLFESQYAGVGAEVFRYFYGGRLGIGLEGELVRKRDPENNFKLNDDIRKTYKTGYLNIYGLLWPSQGIEAGLKIGQFLGEDVGARLELRRSFKYFTIGCWYTDTDTDSFTAPENRGNQEKGIFIRVPLSIFSNKDIRGNLYYSFSSFTRDPGQMVRQPSLLYPIDSYHSLDHTISTLDDMRPR